MRLQQLPLSQQNMISHSLSWLHIEPNAPERRLLDHASGCASQPPKNQEGQEAMGNKHGFSVGPARVAQAKAIAAMTSWSWRLKWKGGAKRMMRVTMRMTMRLTMRTMRTMRTTMMMMMIQWNRHMWIQHIQPPKRWTRKSRGA